MTGGREGDASAFGCYQGAMTAAEGTRRLGLGARFARAAVFLDPRVLIILPLGTSPRREFPLG